MHSAFVHPLTLHLHYTWQIKHFSKDLCLLHTHHCRMAALGMTNHILYTPCNVFYKYLSLFNAQSVSNLKKKRTMFSAYQILYYCPPTHGNAAGSASYSHSTGHVGEGLAIIIWHILQSGYSILLLFTSNIFCNRHCRNRDCLKLTPKWKLFTQM